MMLILHQISKTQTYNLHMHAYSRESVPIIMSPDLAAQIS